MKKRDLGRLKRAGPAFLPIQYPTVSPRIAAAMSRTFSQRIESFPAAAKTPAVTSSESPGRKNPTMSPVSANTIAVMAPSPPTATIVSTSVSL